MMNNRGGYKFLRITVAVRTLRVLQCIEALAEHVVCLKRLKISAFRSSEPLLLLRLNGCIGAILTYRVYRLYDNVICDF